MSCILYVDINIILLSKVLSIFNNLSITDCRAKETLYTIIPIDIN